MLASILARLMDPGDPLSAFSAQTASVRARAVDAFARVLVDTGLPPEVQPLVANTLWLLQLACMLIYVHDDSPGEARTHGLVDDGLDLLVPMLPLFASPPGRMIADRVLAALTRAGLHLANAHAGGVARP